MPRNNHVQNNAFASEGDKILATNSVDKGEEKC